MAMVPIAFVIAGQEGGTFDTHFLLIMGACILLAGAICLGVYFLRRSILDKDTGNGPGFTIEQIDRLHDEGALTEEEYRLARRSALGLTDPDAPE